VDIDAFRDGVADPRGDQAPDHRQDSRETARIVRQVLETLDEKYRTVLILRDLEGLSSKQISDITCIAHATVRWRLHVARKQFRENWERHEQLAARRARAAATQVAHTLDFEKDTTP
jgi:RNA polymerase sigma-70 factor (ECF subfamily)